MNRKTIRILMLLLVAMSLGIGEVKGTTVKNVKYMDWDDTQKKLVERTTPDDVDVTVLEGSTSTEVVMLGGWYVVNGTVNYNGHFRLNSETHLILSDGAQLTCPKIDGNYESLFVYGQGGHAEGSTNVAEGILNVTTRGIEAQNITINGGQVNTNATELNSDPYNGIYANLNITINGGKVTATSEYNDCIFATFDVTINGGQVTATAGANGGFGIYASVKVTINDGQVTATATNTTGPFWYYGICSNNVIINGGQVTASGPDDGIHGGDITLGWTNPTDYILCSSYNNASMETVSGKFFAVYNDDDVFMYVIGSASGKTSFSDISSLGNRIYPFEGKLVPVGSVKNYAYNLSSGSDSYKPLNPGVSVYLVTGIAYNQSTKQYEAVLSEAQPGVVSNVPVIFGADKLPNSIALKKEDATVSLSATPSKNFIACDGTKKVSELLPSGVNFADVYFFGLSGNSFKRVLLGSDDVHPAGTCFLFIPKDDFNNPPSSAPAGVRGIGIETDGTTSLIGNGQLTTDHAASAQWYSLDGRRLDKAPKTKGVYIRNGKKLVIK